MVFRFSRTVRRRFRPVGWAFVLITLLVLLAGWNTGLNLLYIVSSISGGILIVSIVLTGRMLRRIEVKRDAADAVHRGDRFPVSIRIYNRRSIFPVMSLRIEQSLVRGKSAAYIPVIPATGSAEVRIYEQFEKRGVHRLPPIQLATTLPFGLLEARRSFNDALEVVVYPRVTALRSRFLDEMTTSLGASRRQTGDGDEFFSLRDYILGDDIRRIAWRVSARQGTLVVKELEPGTSRFVVVALDTHNPGSIEDFEERFEEAVDLAASLAVTMLHRHYAVSVVTPTATLPFGEGNAHVLRALDMLARVTPTYELSGEEFVQARSVTEAIGRAALLHVSPDPSRWGRRSIPGGGRVLDPREVVRA